MKTMTKFLALLLVCALMVGCVPGLAEVPEGYPEILIDPATGAPYDLGGITVYEYGANGNEDGSRNEPTTVLEMDTQDYQDWLMETYNFQYQIKKVCAYDDLPQSLLEFANQEVASAPVIYSIPQNFMLAPLRAGLLQPFSGYEFLDVNDAGRWNKGVIDVYTLDGKTMALASDFSVGAALVFNKDLLRDCGIEPEDIYAMVENDEWDFESFEEVMKQCTRDLDNDGVFDVYGLVANGQPEFKAAVYDNGGAFFRLNDEGKFYVSAGEDAVVEAMNWFEKIWFTYTYPQPEGANWDYYYEAFKSGKAVFFRAALWELNGDTNPLSHLDEQFEFGAVPFPKGMGVNAQYADAKSPYVYVMPANVPAEDAWKVAFALNMMHTPVPGYTEEDEAWKQSLYNLFCDEESVDLTCAILRESAYLDLTSMIGTPNDMLGSNFLWAYIYDGALGAHTVAELIEGKMPMWTAEIAKANGEAVAE